MTRFKEKASDYKFDVSDQQRTATVPWYLGFGGEPIEMRIPAGAKLLHDAQKQILHTHNPATGLSHTVTPYLQMFVNLDEDFFELTFVDPDNPQHILPGMFITEGTLTFEDKKAFDFINTEMFKALCQAMAHPLLNPWNAPLPRPNEYALTQYDLVTGKIGMHHSVAQERAIDDARCQYVSALLETKEILKGEERRGGEIDLPPGLYDVDFFKCDGNTGDPTVLQLTGTGTACVDYDRVDVDFAATDALFQNRLAEFFNVANRVFFDPRIHMERALKKIRTTQLL